MTANPTGPFTVAAGTTTELQYPQGSSAQAAVVIDNLSPFALQVNVATSIFWLPPFQENVYLLPTNRSPVKVAAFSVPGTPPGITLAGVLATWYAPGDPLPGGTWPMALTGAAIEASIASAGIAGAEVLTLAEPCTAGTFITFALAPGTYRLWNWGWFLLPSGSTPTLGGFVLNPANATDGADDSLTFAEGASSRLAGLAFIVGGGGFITFTNDSDHDVEAFITYSAS